MALQRIAKLPPVDRPAGPSEAEAATDRRRLARLAWGTGLLFLMPLGYAVTHHDAPRPAESRYEFLASAASLPAPDIRLAEDAAAASPAAATPEPASPRTSGAPRKAAPPVKHDQYYCDFYAQDVTGSVTPGQAVLRQQASGGAAGAVGGAVLGAMIGATGRHSGRSAMLGAGAGLLAGVLVGSSHGQRAADEIRSRYQAAFLSCMKEGG